MATRIVDKNGGTYHTIQAAADAAMPGDMVEIHPGIYREHVAPARGGVTYRATGAGVVIRGSEVWSPNWRKTGPSNSPVYTATVPQYLAGPFIVPHAIVPSLSLGQIFHDGEQFRQARSWSEVTATRRSWWWQDGELIVHFPSWSIGQVEITTRDRVFAPFQRGLAEITLDGLTFEHCANQYPHRFWMQDGHPQWGMVGCRAGRNWTIRNCTIRHAKNIGLDCGYEGPDPGGQPTPNYTGGHQIERNRVDLNGCCGIAGMNSTDTVIFDNTVRWNNWNRIQAGETAAIKMHRFTDGHLIDNIVRDNDTFGVWLDTDWEGVRVENNRIVRNAGFGMKVEWGQGPLQVNRNLLAFTRPIPGLIGLWEKRAHGLYLQDASGVTIRQNRIRNNAVYGICARKATTRSGAASNHITLADNVFRENGDAHLNLPWPGPDATGNTIESSNDFGSPGWQVWNTTGGTGDLADLIYQQTGVWPETWPDEIGASVRVRT